MFWCCNLTLQTSSSSEHRKDFRFKLSDGLMNRCSESTLLGMKWNFISLHQQHPSSLVLNGRKSLQPGAEIEPSPEERSLFQQQIKNLWFCNWIVCGCNMWLSTCVYSVYIFHLQGFTLSQFNFSFQNLSELAACRRTIREIKAGGSTCAMWPRDQEIQRWCM